MHQHIRCLFFQPQAVEAELGLALKKNIAIKYEE